MKKINAESDRVESLSQARDKLYRNFLDKSASVYHPTGFESTSPTPLAAATTSVFATISTLTTVAAAAMSTFSSHSSHSDSNNNAAAVDQETPKPNQVTDTSAPNSVSSSSTHVNSFLVSSRAAATNVASTATAATGWLTKQLSTVRLSMTKPQDPPVVVNASNTIPTEEISQTSQDKPEVTNVETETATVEETSPNIVTSNTEFTLHDDTSEGDHRPSEGELDDA